MHAWRAVACQWRHAWNEANGWKLIAACLTIHLNGGPFLAMGDHFWLPKTGPPRVILAAKLGPGQGTSFGKISAKISPGEPFLGGTDFGVIIQSLNHIREEKVGIGCRYKH